MTMYFGFSFLEPSPVTAKRSKRLLKRFSSTKSIDMTILSNTLKVGALFSHSLAAFTCDALLLEPNLCLLRVVPLQLPIDTARLLGEIMCIS